jgi:hypothetical protein
MTWKAKCKTSLLFKLNQSSRNRIYNRTKLPTRVKDLCHTSLIHRIYTERHLSTKDTSMMIQKIVYFDVCATKLQAFGNLSLVDFNSLSSVHWVQQIAFSNSSIDSSLVFCYHFPLNLKRILGRTGI